MAKDTISQYSKTAGSNTDVQSVSIAEGMAPSDVNNAMREVMVDLASLYDGTQSRATFTTTTALSAANGTVSAPSLQATADTNTGVYFPAADTVGVVTGGTEQFRFGSNPIPGGMKNLLINGGMTVSQRGTSFTITPNPSGGDTDYTLDRWAIQADGVDSDYTVTQETLTPGTDEPYDSGFRTSIKVNCDVADASPGATDTMALQQRLEGQNVQVLAYGDAQAKASTVSFWHKHTKTGINCVTINASSGTKWACKQYTQSVSNTWEYATVTIPADTALAPANDTANRLQLMFGISVGSSYTSGAEAAWGTTNGNYFAGQVNNMDSTSNNFEIAGVQWEVGSVATDFAHEDYGTTLQKCRRYFERIGPDEGSEEAMIGVGMGYAAAAGHIAFTYIEKRAIPTFTFGDVTKFQVQIASGSITTTGMSSSRTSRDRTGMNVAVSSGMTADEAFHLRNIGGNADAYIDLSAEL